MAPMNQSLSIDPGLLDLLPDLFRELGKNLPLADLLKLSERYGGTRLYIPKNLREGHDRVARLGKDTARRLIAVAGYDTITVPKCERVRQLLRRREALRLHREGRTMRSIAREFGVTDRTIQSWITAERGREKPATPANFN